MHYTVNKCYSFFIYGEYCYSSGDYKTITLATIEVLPSYISYVDNVVLLLHQWPSYNSSNDGECARRYLWKLHDYSNGCYIIAAVVITVVCSLLLYFQTVVIFVICWWLLYNVINYCALFKLYNDGLPFWFYSVSPVFVILFYNVPEKML